jgi:uncharacterized short protein YbdD (DUF466 family)
MNSHVLRGRLASLWTFVRELATDDAYERYLTHHRGTHPGQTPLDQRTFYLREQQRKWSGVKRCC